MKRKCRKAHESILSKGQGTVVLAICMAIAMFALTACGGEQTGSVGNSADSDAMSSGVDIANRESEEFPEEKGSAELPQPYARYMEILEQIMTEGHDSNGREYYWNEPWNFENNCFAVLDVDNDRRQELLFNFNESYTGDMCEVVYEYDEETDILREELITWVNISGNMSVGVSGSIQEDASAKSGDMIIFDWEEYSAWAEELMPEWSRIHVSYHRMTEDFMERVQSAYVQATAYAAQADKW